jgi:murein DD-endopeptidase MepM/ murein hydrolase activator NlpD
MIVSTLTRMATHAAFLAVCVALLVLIYPQLLGRDALALIPDSGAARSVPSSRGNMAASVAALDTDFLSQDVDLDMPVSAAITTTLPLAANGKLFVTPQLQTIIPKRPRKELVTYTVQSGDNLSTLAERYDVDVDTIIWANDKLEEDPDYLVLGQVLIIPPVSGVLYTFKTGDVLADIVTKYKGELRTMKELEFNSAALAASAPVSGTKVMIPGGEKAYQPRLVYIGGQAVMVNAPKGGGRFMWPTQGYISTFFGDSGHAGIDIAGPLGTPIYAADAGVVTFSGWNGGYGNCVIIDHGNGYVTLYSHFSSYYPQAGQNVRRGQAIGKMGSTGNSTGSHLHFEIHYQGGLVNPLRYLPQ